MSNVIQITTSDVPVSLCYTTLAETWPQLVNLLAATMNGTLNSVNTGSDTPGPEDRDKPWVRSNADGSMDKTYVYFNGSWIARHPMPAGSIVMYEGSEASIVTFDGGEAGTATSVSGQMWEKVSELDAKIPIGPGTTPAGTSLSVTGTGGTDEYSLTIGREYLPAQPLYTGVEGSTNVTESNDDRKPLGFLRVGGGESISYTQDSTKQSKVARTSNLGDGEDYEFNQLPPYYSVWFIRRTARLYYRI